MLKRKRGGGEKEKRALTFLRSNWDPVLFPLSGSREKKKGRGEKVRFRFVLPLWESISCQRPYGRSQGEGGKGEKKKEGSDGGGHRPASAGRPGR